MIPIINLDLLGEAGYTQLLKWREETRSDEVISIVSILEYCGFRDAVWALRFCRDSREFSIELTKQLSTHILDTIEDSKEKTQLIDAINVVCKYWLGEVTADEVKYQEEIIEDIYDENLNDVKDLVLGLVRTPTPQEGAFWIVFETAKFVPEELDWQEQCLRKMLLHEILEEEPRGSKMIDIKIPVLDEKGNVVCNIDRPWFWNDPGLWNRFDVVPLEDGRYAIVRGTIADAVSEETALKEIMKRWKYKKVDNHPSLRYTNIKNLYLEKICENVQITKHDDGSVSWGGKEEEVPFECAKWVFKKIMGGGNENGNREND